MSPVESPGGGRERAKQKAQQDMAPWYESYGRRWLLDWLTAHHRIDFTGHRRAMLGAIDGLARQE